MEIGADLEDVPAVVSGLRDHAPDLAQIHRRPPARSSPEGTYLTGAAGEQSLPPGSPPFPAVDPLRHDRSKAGAIRSVSAMSAGERPRWRAGGRRGWR